MTLERKLITRLSLPPLKVTHITALQVRSQSSPIPKANFARPTARRHSLNGERGAEDRAQTGPQGACPRPQRDAGRQRGGDSGRQPPAPSGAADLLAGRQVAAGREAATCGTACRGRGDRELWGRTGALPPPPGKGPFIKPKGIAGAWQPWTPNCKLIKEFASHLHGNHFLGPQQRTVLSIHQTSCAQFDPSTDWDRRWPCLGPVFPPYLPHWESRDRGWMAEHPSARSPACAPGELALPQWVQAREVLAKSFAPRPGCA